MTRTQAEWASWAREHRAAFQTAPLIEIVRGEKVQVGFSLTLYVAAPMDKTPGEKLASLSCPVPPGSAGGATVLLGHGGGGRLSRRLVEALRDLLVLEIPMVLHADFYATAALLGGLSFVLLNAAGFHPPVVSAAAFLTTLSLRTAAIYLGWSLPKLR